jgi:hypothetical protein
MGPVADAVRYILVLSDSLTEESLLLLETLADRSLTDAPSLVAYEQLLQDLASVWERIDSFERLDWGLAILDLLCRHPVRDRGRFEQFAVSVLNRVRLSHHRCSRGQLTLAALLAHESTLSDMVPEISEDTVDRGGTQWQQLDGAVVGIYCLMTPVAQRVKAVIELLCKPRIVELEESRDCSASLKSLSRKADVLLVATQHAKHAATDCIRAHLRPEARLVEARQSSIGSSGLLAALEQALTPRGLSEPAA